MGPTGDQRPSGQSHRWSLGETRDGFCGPQVLSAGVALVLPCSGLKDEVLLSHSPERWRRGNQVAGEGDPLECEAR